MDSFNHFTQGFLIGYIPTSNVVVGVMSGIVGTLPDLVGDEFYVEFHDVKLGKKLWWLLPFSLHIYLDSLCHGEGKRWYAGKFWEYLVGPYRERMYFETGFWALNIILLILKFTL